MIVPLNYWLEQREFLLKRGDVSVWLGSDQPPAPLADDLAALEVIAIDFPLFMDGRGFSYGRTLREHFGYKGEVRAIGQFIRDQLYYLTRCGFDAFALGKPPIQKPHWRASMISPARIRQRSNNHCRGFAARKNKLQAL